VARADRAARPVHRAGRALAEHDRAPRPARPGPTATAPAPGHRPRCRRPRARARRIRGHQAARQQAIAACVAEGAHISTDWSATTRAALERSFLATGKHHAATAVAKTTPWLDRWATSWRAARESTCRAHTVDATLDDDLHARAEDCLDDARGTFRALVRELVDANATTLTHATVAAAGLASVDACLRPESLRERPMMHPAQRDEVSAIRARLAQAASRAVAGEYAAGLTIAHGALEAARAARWPAVVAEAEAHVADLESNAGDYARAEASLLRALAAAREADSPGQALRITTELALVVGEKAARHAEGKVWAEGARTLLELLPSEHLLAQARLDNHLGTIHSNMGAHDEATRLYASSLAIYRAALGEDHPNVGISLTNLAIVKRNIGAFDEAADLYTRALAISEATLGPDHPDVATILNNLAVVRDETGAYEEALRLYTRVLAIREPALGPDHPDIGAALNNLAVVHFTLGAHDEALRLNNRALAIWEAALGPDHPLIALSLGNLAGLALIRDDPAEANRLNTRALAIQEAALGPNHPDLATTLNNLASGHTALADYPRRPCA
jgi:tetratricopeptide (TPR) repeat protein